MSEWIALVATVWLFWCLDGVRLCPRATWTFSAWRGAGRAQAEFSRWLRPFWSPWAWRAVVADPAVALSPHGLLARSIGMAGRSERQRRAAAVAWENVREVKCDDGWLWVNGEKFAPDTGHVTARELRELAALPVARRDAAIHALWRDWFRVERLRRWRQVWSGRTAEAALMQGWLLVLAVMATSFLCGLLPDRWAIAVHRASLGMALSALIAHVFVIWSFARASRRPVFRQQARRGSPLLTAALFPPQALKLRSTLGELALRRAHPIAVAVSLGQREVALSIAQQTISDLRWPIDGAEDDPLGQQIAAWQRTGLQREIAVLLERVNLPPSDVMRAPEPDGAASCSYCPRCRAQFVAGPAHCPHGVRLEPLRRE